VSPRLSIIIPTLNEAAVIEKTLAALPRTGDVEFIVADGGSSDGTPELAKRWADKVLTTETGRGRQMNAGAREARGDFLLFLHADVRLPYEAFETVFKTLDDPAVAGGAFRLAIDSPRRMLRIVAGTANLRSRLTKIPYGDQGIFVRRSVFERLGGYPEWPVMEDLEFVRRLKTAGAVVILPQPITVSSRRWDKEGIGYTTLRNQIFVLLYFLGASPRRLARWYRPIR